MTITSAGTVSGAPLGTFTAVDGAADWDGDAMADRVETTGTGAEGSHPLDLSGRVVLLAVDDSAGANAGACVALALATKHHAIIHVLHVVDSRPAPIPPPLDLALAMGDTLIGADVQQQRIRDLRAKLSADTGQTIDWSVGVRLGTPANAIVEEAQRLSAALIIVGLRRHDRVERLLNDETALNVMRNAACPVLGIVPGTTGLPTRVVAAVDFSKTSVLAARAACAVVGDGAVLVLAYVPPLGGQLPDAGESVIHDLGVEAGFTKIVREFGNAGVTFDHVVLHHELPRTAAEMILEYAEVAPSDLIAAGSARHGRFDRWMVGSVSTDLVRNGSYSILVVPPPKTGTNPSIPRS